MGIALVIVGGLALMTLMAVIGDVAGKSRKAGSTSGARELTELMRRVEFLEQDSRERRDRIQELESEISFINKLLEDKTGEN